MGNAATPVNNDSTRHVLQTQITYANSGKVSGAIFWLYQLEKWRVTGNGFVKYTSLSLFSSISQPKITLVLCMKSCSIATLTGCKKNHNFHNLQGCLKSSWPGRNGTRRIKWLLFLSSLNLQIAYQIFSNSYFN